MLIFGCGKEQPQPPIFSQQVQKPQQSIPQFDGNSAFAFLKKQTDFGSRSPGSPAHEKCLRYLQTEMQKYADYVKVEVVSDNKAIVYVPDHAIAGIIGKQGKNIEKIEDTLGISIDVRELEKKDIEPVGNEIDFDVKMANKYNVLMVDEEYVNKDVDIYINNELLLSVKVGKNAEIKIKKNNNIGKTLLNAIEYKEEIKLVC